MSTTQTVKIPADRKPHLDFEVPMEIPIGKAQVEFKVIPEEKNAQVTPISSITERLEKYKSYTNLPFIEKLPFILELMLDNEFKQNIQKIYLFGSYAYGEPNENSDIDFCVIIDDAISVNRNDVYFKIEKKLLSKHMVPNDLLVYNAGTFDKFKYDRGIERVVVTYGVLIYDRK